MQNLNWFVWFWFIIMYRCESISRATLLPSIKRAPSGLILMELPCVFIIQLVGGSISFQLLLYIFTIHLHRCSLWSTASGWGQHALVHHNTLFQISRRSACQTKHKVYKIFVIELIYELYNTNNIVNTCRELLESHFLSCLKEADVLKHRGLVISAMQKKDHNQLWLGLINEKFDQFWAVNRRLMEPYSDQESFKNIPVRFYNDDVSYRQIFVSKLS